MNVSERKNHLVITAQLSCKDDPSLRVMAIPRDVYRLPSFRNEQCVLHLIHKDSGLTNLQFCTIHLLPSTTLAPAWKSCLEGPEPTAQKGKLCSGQGMASSKPGLQLHLLHYQNHPSVRSGPDKLWPFQTCDRTET